MLSPASPRAATSHFVTIATTRTHAQAIQKARKDLAACAREPLHLVDRQRALGVLKWLVETAEQLARTSTEGQSGSRALIMAVNAFEDGIDAMQQGAQLHGLPVSMTPHFMPVWAMAPLRIRLLDAAATISVRHGAHYMLAAAAWVSVAAAAHMFNRQVAAWQAYRAAKHEEWREWYEEASTAQRQHDRSVRSLGARHSAWLNSANAAAQRRQHELAASQAEAERHAMAVADAESLLYAKLQHLQCMKHLEDAILHRIGQARAARARHCGPSPADVANAGLPPLKGTLVLKVVALREIAGVRLLKLADPHLTLKISHGLARVPVKSNFTGLARGALSGDVDMRAKLDFPGSAAALGSQLEHVACELRHKFTDTGKSAVLGSGAIDMVPIVQQVVEQAAGLVAEEHDFDAAMDQLQGIAMATAPDWVILRPPRGGTSVSVGFIAAVLEWRPDVPSLAQWLQQRGLWRLAPPPPPDPSEERQQVQDAEAALRDVSAALVEATAVQEEREAACQPDAIHARYEQAMQDLGPEPEAPGVLELPPEPFVPPPPPDSVFFADSLSQASNAAGAAGHRELALSLAQASVQAAREHVRSWTMRAAAAAAAEEETAMALSEGASDEETASLDDSGVDREPEEQPSASPGESSKPPEPQHIGESWLVPSQCNAKLAAAAAENAKRGLALAYHSLAAQLEVTGMHAAASQHYAHAIEVLRSTIPEQGSAEDSEPGSHMEATTGGSTPRRTKPPVPAQATPKQRRRQSLATSDFTLLLRMERDQADCNALLERKQAKQSEAVSKGTRQGNPGSTYSDVAGSATDTGPVLMPADSVDAFEPYVGPAVIGDTRPGMDLEHRKVLQLDQQFRSRRSSSAMNQSQHTAPRSASALAREYAPSAADDAFEASLLDAQAKLAHVSPGLAGMLGIAARAGKKQRPRRSQPGQGKVSCPALMLLKLGYKPAALVPLGALQDEIFTSEPWYMEDDFANAGSDTPLPAFSLESLGEQAAAEGLDDEASMLWMTSQLELITAQSREATLAGAPAIASAWDSYAAPMPQPPRHAGGAPAAAWRRPQTAPMGRAALQRRPMPLPSRVQQQQQHGAALHEDSLLDMSGLGRAVDLRSPSGHLYIADGSDSDDFGSIVQAHMMRSGPPGIRASTAQSRHSPIAAPPPRAYTAVDQHSGVHSPIRPTAGMRPLPSSPAARRGKYVPSSQQGYDDKGQQQPREPAMSPRRDSSNDKLFMSHVVRTNFDLRQPAEHTGYSSAQAAAQHAKLYPGLSYASGRDMQSSALRPTGKLDVGTRPATAGRPGPAMGQSQGAAWPDSRQLRSAEGVAGWARNTHFTSR